MAQVVRQRRIQVRSRSVQMQAHGLHSMQVSGTLRERGEEDGRRRGSTLDEHGVAIPNACEGFLHVHDPHASSLEEPRPAAMLPMVVPD
jgi:hypothetical protein